MYNNLLHCHTKNTLLEREIKGKKIPMIIASKRIIYLGIKFTKEAKSSVHLKVQNIAERNLKDTNK